MRIGVIPAANGGIEPSGSYVAEYVATAEAQGFDSVWIGEHPALPASPDTAYPGRSEGLAEPSAAPLPDPFEWLAFAAAHTTTMLLGTAVVILPLHHPVVLAKRVATLDQVSGGRALLGIGVGWNRQEYVACGASWNDRGLRADESMAALRTLWSDDVASFNGPTVSFEPVFSSPKPVRRSVPIHVGATGLPGARRAGRLGDGYLPFERDHEQLADLIGVMKRAADDAGRDPDSIEITCLGSTTPAKVKTLVHLGVSRMLFFVADINALSALAQRANDAIS